MTNASENNAEHNPFVAPRTAVDDVQDFADSRFKLSLFSSDGRIGRVRYLTYSMGINLLVLLVAGVVSFVIPPIFFLTYPVVMYVALMLAIKRCHDFDTTGWLSLLVFIPLVGLIFMFIPGTDGPNRFGRKTAPNGSTGVILISIVVGVAIIGMLAAIAIPAYVGYTQRAHAAQAAQGASQNLPAAQ